MNNIKDVETSLRESVIKAAIKYHKIVHEEKKYTDGDPIPYAKRVFDENEIVNLINASLDFWLTAGRYAKEFEEGLSKFLGIKYCSLTNSGSSANLLAVMSLTSSRLGKKRLRKGDEVITVSAGFPTTVTPLVQYGAVPVFLDIVLPTYNIDCSLLEEALSEKTKAVMLAHTLGNPFDIEKVKRFCDKHDLWLIEDNCDSLGSKYFYNGQWRYCGTFGDIGTSSFYPPHHITMGEGGAVYTNCFGLKRLIESFRDWGRDCWCQSGHDNTCKKRFAQQWGELPFGYDHKYVYSHFGYNLKVTDLQAAIGVAQLNKLPSFIKRRKRNWKLLYDGLSDLSEYFILPEATENSDPSWFGFLLTIRKDSGFTRSQLIDYLESMGIQTRMLFAGNLIKHPCFDEMRNSGNHFRVIGDLKNTDLIMNQTFWIGVYPGITEEKIEYMLNTFHDFFTKSSTKGSA